MAGVSIDQLYIDGKRPEQSKCFVLVYLSKQQAVFIAKRAVLIDDIMQVIGQS
jgi:hypothetical protein